MHSKPYNSLTLKNNVQNSQYYAIFVYKASEMQRGAETPFLKSDL